MTGSSPTGLEETAETSAAPRVISAPCRNKPAEGDSLDFEVIGGVPFCFYRFTDRAFMEHLRELCLAVEGDIMKLPVADNWDAEQSDQEMQQFGTTSRFPYYNMLLLEDVSVIHIFRAIQRCYLTAAEHQGLDQITGLGAVLGERVAARRPFAQARTQFFHARTSDGGDSRL